MGYGDYSRAAHSALIRGREQHPERTFAAPRVHPLMEPLHARRECRDSAEHPTSLGILFALDVTGSMGRIPSELANQSLPALMEALLDARIDHPALCFMAVGHALDQAPLQIGQFESTASLIDAWLTRIWMEGGGAGQHECYELAMYVAARHVALDSVSKRGERGVFFLTADTAPNPAVSRTQVQRIIGDSLDQDLPIRTLIEELQATFEPFVLLASSSSARVERAWRDLFGDRVVRMEDPADAAYVCAGLVALLRGSVASLHGWMARLEAMGLRRRQLVRIAQGLLPFATSIARTGEPRPVNKPLALPVGDAPSGMERS